MLNLASAASSTDSQPRYTVSMALEYADSGEVRRYLNLNLAPDATALSAPGQAMRARVDVVDSAQSDGSLGRQVRLRMDVVQTTVTTNTATDLGDGDGNSNVIQVTLPLTAPAPPADETTPPSGDTPSDQPGNDAPADGQPSGDQPSSDQPSHHHPWGDKP